MSPRTEAVAALAGVGAAITLVVFWWLRRSAELGAHRPRAYTTRVRLWITVHPTSWALWPLWQYNAGLSPEEEPQGRKQLRGDRYIANEEFTVNVLLLSLTLVILYRKREVNP